MTHINYWNISTVYLHIRIYILEQLHDILLLKRPNYPQELYYSFLQAFLPSVYHSERNLNILIRLVKFLINIDFKNKIDTLPWTYFKTYEKI